MAPDRCAHARCQHASGNDPGLSLDAWFEQTFLVSRCVAGAGEKVNSELRARVISRLITALRSWRAFDRQRALMHLSELIHARTNEAIRAAHHLLREGNADALVHVRTAAMLAEVGDEYGLEVARESLENRAISARHRAWCARAVVLADDAEGLVTLLLAINTARTLGELRTLVNAVPVESSVGSDLAAQILRDQDVHVTIRSAVGSALVRAGDSHRIQLAKELASTPLTVWSLRAALVADLLAIGEDDIVPIGLELCDDPNLSAVQRVTLVEALIRRGEAAVLPRAVRLLARRDVHWESRRMLARAIAELGPPGINELMRQVNSPLAIDLKLRHIIALVEVGECLDLAAELVADAGAPLWIRARAATSLLERGYLALADDVIQDLANEADNEFRGELIIAMVGRDIKGAAEVTKKYLAGSWASSQTYSGSGRFIRNLAAQGPEGHEVLVKIANDREIAEEDRALAIISVGDATPAEAAELAESFADQFSAFSNLRITALLADKGVTELADRLATSLLDEPETYGTLYRLLSSPRASRELVDRFLPVGDEETRSTAPEARPPVALDSQFLEEAGLSWSSEAEKRAILGWIRNKVGSRVGQRLSAFLTEGQLDEFEELDEPEQLEFLSVRAAGYPDLVKGEFLALQTEIRSEPSIVPDFSSVKDQPALIRLAYISSTLAEWVTVTQARGAHVSSQFLRANKSAIVSEESYALLQLAGDITGAWNPHEGHLYLVGLALHDGLNVALEAMTGTEKLHDLLRGYLSERRGADLLFGALASIVLRQAYPEVAYFYGSLGAAMIEDWQLSVQLMMLSGGGAGQEQKDEGLRTLERNAARFEWDAEFVAKLRAALSGQEETQA